MHKIDEGGVNRNIGYFRETVNNGSNVELATRGGNQHDSSIQCTPIASMTHFFLGRLIDTANQNIKRKKNGYRYDVDIRRFATYLRMIVGPLGYETIQRNLECALPSLPSTNRYVQTSSCSVTECILRCRELLLYLNERNAPLVVSLSEDATRIIGRPQYDSRTNQVVGFVAPLDSNTGLPVPFAYPARNADEMIHHFSNKHPIAPFVNIVMAQPVGPDYIAPFCLLLFGSDSSYTSLDVQKRWVFIIKELNKLDIRVLAVASDSDPKYNSCMRALSGLGSESNLFKNLNQNTNWFECGTFSSDDKSTVFIQDTVHIATKMRNFLLTTNRKSHKLKFGNYYIQSDHLQQLINSIPKDRHRLTQNVINPIDRQNFQSAKRICDRIVTESLIKHVRGSQGTTKFLEMMRNMIDSFLNTNLSALERVHKLWYTVFLVRIWRHFVISHKNLTIKDNFLSIWSHTCIELNAHSMVHCLVNLRESPELFQPHLLDSQPCESTFRQIRSLSHVYSTVTNCTIKEVSDRMKKIQLQNDIISTSCPNYIFPKLKRMKDKNDSKSIPLPSTREIYDEIERSRKSALSDAIKLGLITRADGGSFNFECQVKPYVRPLDENKIESNQKRMKIAKLPLKKKLKRLCCYKERCRMRNPRNIEWCSNHRNIEFKRKPTSEYERNILRLRSITLKNFADKFVGTTVEESSPYVEVYRGNAKRTIVKKTSFCWLLRRDVERLSSDRLERVRARSNSVKSKYRKKSKNFKRKKKGTRRFE